MHGSEAYYVVGEGLLSEANENGAGTAAPLAMAAAAAPPFRFSRMAPKGTQLGDPARKKLALAMTEAVLRRLGATPDQIDRERDRVRAELFQVPVQ